MKKTTKIKQKVKKNIELPQIINKKPIFQEKKLDFQQQSQESQTQVTKADQNIRDELQSFYKKNKTKEKIPISDIDPQRILKKLKKYEPANSSFSLFYGEKKTMDLRNLKKEQMKKENRSSENDNEDVVKSKINIFLPSLEHHQNRKNENQKFAKLRHRNPSMESISALTHRSRSSQNVVFLGKIKNIYDYGQLITQRSEILFKNVDRVVLSLQKQYEVLDEKSNQMLADDGMGRHRLQEQNSPEYRKQLLQMWMINDASRR